MDERELLADLEADFERRLDLNAGNPDLTRTYNAWLMELRTLAQRARRLTLAEAVAEERRELESQRRYHLDKGYSLGAETCDLYLSCLDEVGKAIA